LIAELAIRRYRLENGVNPPSLEAMVPRYLARVPLDPYSGKTILYRPDHPEGRRLYCVGPDGKDDLGSALPERSDWSKSRGDVLVEPRKAAGPPDKPDSRLKTPSAEKP